MLAADLRDDDYHYRDVGHYCAVLIRGQHCNIDGYDSDLRYLVLDDLLNPHQSRHIHFFLQPLTSTLRTLLLLLVIHPRVVCLHLALLGQDAPRFFGVADVDLHLVLRLPLVGFLEELYDLYDKDEDEH